MDCLIGSDVEKRRRTGSGAKDPTRRDRNGIDWFLSLVSTKRSFAIYSGTPSRPLKSLYDCSFVRGVDKGTPCKHGGLNND